MAKKGEISDFEEQKKNKPTFRSLIDQLSDGELRKTGIDFLEYLSTLRNKPTWYATNSYSVSYKGQRVCLIRIDIDYTGEDRHLYNYGNDRFLVHLRAPDMQMFAEFISELPENKKQRYLDRIIKCSGCSRCRPGVSVTVKGISFNNVCNRGIKAYRNPNSEQLEEIKKFIEFRRQDITNGRAL